ncbi:MAG: LPXTG cell wall anchor domain-containing protein, partial [Lachnospiraceae bacterium]|nr:LPXTG cell wall anchor domain-containing protein [Lachnospiraceae bacterium]
WSVVETSVPMGYRAMYSRHGNTIVITNVSSLLQTGQLNWPIYLLLIAAAMLLTAGIIAKSKKRKHNV